METKTSKVVQRFKSSHFKLAKLDATDWTWRWCALAVDAAEKKINFNVKQDI